MLMDKFEKNVARAYSGRQRKRVLAWCRDAARLRELPVHAFTDELV